MFESHCCCCCFQGKNPSMLVYCHVSCLHTHHHESRLPSLLAECLSSPQPSRIIYLLFHFHTCTQLLQPDKNLNPSSSSLQLLHCCSVDCNQRKTCVFTCHLILFIFHKQYKDIIFGCLVIVKTSVQ